MGTKVSLMTAETTIAGTDLLYVIDDPGGTPLSRKATVNNVLAVLGVPQHNFAASSAPATSDDTGSGYSVGSQWYDTTADTAYLCLDATSSNAVWVEVSEVGDLGPYATNSHSLAASTAPTTSDDSGSGYSVGSIWIDTTADKLYVCLDATSSNAVWVEVAEVGNLGAYATNSHNLAASTAPTTSDDTGSGYSVGSIWVNTTADTAYICLDATSSNAVWTEVTQSGGGGSSTPFIVFTPAQGDPPASNYATLDTRNSHSVAEFDAATDESRLWSSVLPAGYSSGGLTVQIHWAADTATSGSVVWNAAIERIGDQVLDIDADSFATAQAATVTAPATNGFVDVATITFTDGAQMDSLAAGELFRLKVTRDADNGSDTMAGDAQLVMVVLKETS